MAQPREKCLNFYEGALRTSLIVIISYPASQSRIIVLSKTLPHTIGFLNKKKVKESNAAIEKTEKKQRLCAELNEFNETNRRERRSFPLGKI